MFVLLIIEITIHDSPIIELHHEYHY